MLAPGARFARLQETEIGLVIRVNARHQFDVGAEFTLRGGVRQIAIPGIAEGMIAPGPLLFARRDVVIRQQHDARLRRMVISSAKILARAQAHVRTRRGNVGIERQIIRRVIYRCFPAAMGRHELRGAFGSRDTTARALAVINPIISSFAQGVLADRAPGVIRHARHIRREKRLNGFVRLDRHVRPPQKGLRERRAVGHTRFDFHVSAAGMQAKAVHAFQVRHRIVIAAPHGFGAIGVFFHVKVHRHKSCRAVVLRPIKLHPTTRPRPRQPDQGGFNHFLPVN